MPQSSSSLEADVEPFRVEVHPERDGVRVVPVGEVDVATVGEFDDRLGELHRKNELRRLVLDLRQLTFMDSSGLRLILDWDDRTRRAGTSFAVIPGPSAVQRLFEVTGLLDQLPFEAR
jgi:anti-sigma B factor antagonist